MQRLWPAGHANYLWAAAAEDLCRLCCRASAEDQYWATRRAADDCSEEEEDDDSDDNENEGYSNNGSKESDSNDGSTEVTVAALLEGNEKSRSSPQLPCKWLVEAFLRSYAPLSVAFSLPATASNSSNSTDSFLYRDLVDMDSSGLPSPLSHDRDAFDLFSLVVAQLSCCLEVAESSALPPVSYELDSAAAVPLENI